MPAKKKASKAKVQVKDMKTRKNPKGGGVKPTVAELKAAKGGR